MARAHPTRFWRSHPHSNDPTDIAAARRQGGPDPRAYELLHQQGLHAAAHDNITDEVRDLNNLHPDERQAITTRVEVIERLPWLQQIFASRQWLGGLVSERYQNHFSLLEYAYGRDAHDDHEPRYYISRTLDGYVVPLPDARTAPDTGPRRDPPYQGRHNDLVIAAHGDSSWAGTLGAYAHPARAHHYEHAVGVGPDIDVLGLGERSDHVIDEMARITPGNVTGSRTALLNQIEGDLQALYTGAAYYPGPPIPPADRR